jgi:diketogulonate reductase-like aldo/keto reductase
MKRHLDEIADANMSLPMVNQCEFSLYYNNKELFDLCNKMEIQFEVFLLTRLLKFLFWSFNKPLQFIQGYSPLGKGNLLNDSTVISLAKKYDKTPAQIAIKWSIMVILLLSFKCEHF